MKKNYQVTSFLLLQQHHDLRIDPLPQDQVFAQVMSGYAAQASVFLWAVSVIVEQTVAMLLMKEIVVSWTSYSYYLFFFSSVPLFYFTLSFFSDTGSKLVVEFLISVSSIFLYFIIFWFKSDFYFYNFSLIIFHSFILFLFSHKKKF